MSVKSRNKAVYTVWRNEGEGEGKDRFLLTFSPQHQLHGPEIHLHIRKENPILSH